MRKLLWCVCIAYTGKHGHMEAIWNDTRMQFVLTSMQFGTLIYGNPQPPDHPRHCNLSPSHCACVYSASAVLVLLCYIVWYGISSTVVNSFLMQYFLLFHFSPQLYHGSDLMYEMRRRKPEPIILQGMVWEELAFDGTVSYTQQGNGLPHR